MQIVERNIMKRFEVGELVVGPYQMRMLALLDSVGRSAPPPKGALTSTGKLRKHLLDDMISKQLVAIDVLQPGLANYFITRLGRMVLKEGSATKAPKRSKLLAKQRTRVNGKARNKKNGRAKRAA